MKSFVSTYYVYPMSVSCSMMMMLLSFLEFTKKTIFSLFHEGMLLLYSTLYFYFSFLRSTCMYVYTTCMYVYTTHVGFRSRRF